MDLLEKLGLTEADFKPKKTNLERIETFEELVDMAYINSEYATVLAELALYYWGD